MNPSIVASPSFDAQASGYEARAGLPSAVGQAVATALLDGVPPPVRLLDVGAGTGTIGRHLIAAGVHYCGLDASAAMLDELRRSLPQLGAPSRVALHAVDANRPWPVEAQSVDVVLFSRSLHHLDGAHALAEVRRVGAPGARVWVGRVRKHEDSVAERLRRRLQELLRERGLAGRSGERAGRALLDALAAHGAAPLPLWRSAPWSTAASVDSLVADWRGKPGVGGRALDGALQQELLDELAAWARIELGDPGTLHEVVRHYELQGARLAK